MNPNRIQQTGRYASAKPQTQINEDLFDEEEYDGDADDAWPTRMPSSTRRYQKLPDVKAEVGRAKADVQSPPRQHRYPTNSSGRKSTIPPRRSATQTGIPVAQPPRQRPVDTDDIIPQAQDDLRGKWHIHWLVFVGIAMLTMLLGWVLLSMVANWWQVTQDDWHYGRPRTFQTDMLVGHNDSAAQPSHFIAINLNRHIEIIEFPGGDPSQAKIYNGPTLIGQGQDLAAVTLSFKDVNGDGLLDMIVNVQDTHFVFINDKKQFRPAHEGENVQL